MLYADEELMGVQLETDISLQKSKELVLVTITEPAQESFACL